MMELQLTHSSLPGPLKTRPQQPLARSTFPAPHTQHPSHTLPPFPAMHGHVLVTQVAPTLEGRANVKFTFFFWELL